MPQFDELRDRLELPVVCAPMFLISGVELVVAACEAGVIGAFPTMNCRTVADLARWLEDITRRLASARDPGKKIAPWAANLVVHSSNKRMQEDLELIVNFRAPLVITALGSPRRVIDAVHGYGGLVFADVITPGFARKAAETGADGLVLVCTGAGGHFGPLAAPAFIEEVRRFWSGPVMLSGAVANGRAIRSYQTLGADLVYIGTSFIAAHESLAAEGYKRMLLDCNAEDIVPTNKITGAWANFLKPSMLAAGFDAANIGAKKIDANDPQSEAQPWKNIWSAGQSVGQVSAMEPVAEIVARLKREYAEAVARELRDPWTRRYAPLPG